MCLKYVRGLKEIENFLRKSYGSLIYSCHIRKKRACEKTKVFSCVLLFLDATVVIFYKKVYNSPYPIRKVIMESYAAVTAFFCLL